MNANELMIGDWVRIAPYDIIDQVDCLLTEYAVTSHGDTCGQYEYKDIEPILLTQEVLEKNGFVCVEVGDNGIGTPAKFRNRFEKWECRTQWHTFHVFYDRIRHSFSLNAAYSNHIEGMQYVHELQHALRISGIDKEVEL